MLFPAQRGYRVIAHDRRRHGCSSQPWNGNDLNTYAGDLAGLVQHLDLHDAVHVGHSTGGGEVVRYVARHGSVCVAKVVTIGAIPPIMVYGPSNSLGAPIEVFDGISNSGCGSEDVRKGSPLLAMGRFPRFLRARLAGAQDDARHGARQAVRHGPEQGGVGHRRAAAAASSPRQAPTHDLLALVVFG